MSKSDLENNQNGFSVGKVMTSVVGALLFAAIIFVYQSISNLQDSVHQMEVTFVRTVGELRSELRQYHTIVGVQQESINKLERKIEK